MCEQCLINPLYYGEVIRGLYLIRARRQSDDTNVGQWGLLQCNNPDFVWTSFPAVSKEDDLYPPEDFVEALDNFMSLDSAYAYIFSMIEAGFSPEDKDRLFIGNQASNWLWNKIAEHVAQTTPTTDEDPFPHLDSLREHDYTLS